MIRFWRAMAWARWRILVNSLKVGSGRDRLELLSRVGNIATPIFLTVMLVPAVLGLAAAAFYGGSSIARGEAIGLVVVSARVGLALVLTAVVVAPLFRSLQGSQMNLDRLLLLPVSRRALHISEMVTGLADPWVAAIVPALFLLPAGMMVGGAWARGFVMLVGGAMFLATLAALGSFCAFGFVLIFRNRRRAEFVTLLLMILLMFSGVGIALFDGGLDRELQRDRSGEGAAPDFDAMFRWAAGLPSEIYGRTIESAAHGKIGSAITSIALLAAICAGLWGLSAVVYRRVLDNKETGSARRGRLPLDIRLARVPGCGSTTSAVAATQIRTALRTVRGKIGTFFGFALLALIYVLVGSQIKSALPLSFDLNAGPLLVIAGGSFSLLMLQPILLNQFAVDRAGLTIQFLAPISDLEIVHGKLVGSAILAGTSVALSFVAALIVAPGGDPLEWVAALLVCASAILIFAPLASLISIFLPKTADLTQMGKGGNPHALANFLGFVLAGLTVLPPAALLTLTALATGSPGLALVASVVFTCVAFLFAVAMARLAARAVAHRRENLLLVAAGR